MKKTIDRQIEEKKKAVQDCVQFFFSLPVSSEKTAVTVKALLWPLLTEQPHQNCTTEQGLLYESKWSLV